MAQNWRSIRGPIIAVMSVLLRPLMAFTNNAPSVAALKSFASLARMSRHPAFHAKIGMTHVSISVRRTAMLGDAIAMRLQRARAVCTCFAPSAHLLRRVSEKVMPNTVA